MADQKLSFNFDKEQLKAIRHGKGPMLVLAGPGSGKTTVLTYRIRNLNTEFGVKESEMLVLTFTRAAANEMKERYLKLTGSQKTEVTFGTFHSVFYRILKRYSDISENGICERSRSLEMIEEILSRKYGNDFSPGTVSEEICDQISRMKNGMPVSSDLANDVYSELNREMRIRKLIDYDDMLLQFLYLLTDVPEMLSALREQYRYILVDEFQDLNRTQYEILKLLAGNSRNVFAVGDDDQSIYGFRGSDPAYMKLFLKDFSSCKTVVLAVNHRSTGEIVKASSKVIRHNRNRFPKRLKTANPKGMEPLYKKFETCEEEASYVRERILMLRASAATAGLNDPSIAILARTGTALSSVCEYLSDELLKGITVMTFHSSKGLEFDAVFIVGASEGITPDHRAMENKELEEERRAFYVAVTRAKRYLHIFDTKHFYNKQVQSSRFIREMFSVL